jgi:hypothetical protein
MGSWGLSGSWVGQSGNSAAASQTLRFELGTDATYESDLELRAGWVITEVFTQIESGNEYSPGTTIEVGPSGGTVDLLQTADDTRPDESGDYLNPEYVVWPADAKVTVTIGGTPAAGSAVLLVTYTQTPSS